MDMTPRKSMLLGGASALFKDQMSADIYLYYAWAVQGVLQRIGHITVTYGISAAVIQVGVCPRAGEMPAHWTTHSPSLHLITVEDDGPQFMDVDGAPTDLPNSDMLPDDPNVETLYFMNEAMLAAKPIPWHHKVTLKPSTPGATLHYHEHGSRRGHGPPPRIRPQTKGKYREFKKLVYSTQVQSCRLTKDVIRTYDPTKNASTTT